MATSDSSALQCGHELRHAARQRAFAAGRAGLRDGDVLDQPVVPGGADKALELVVLRDGAKKTIRYLPQGESVNGTGWSRVAGVPDSACARPLPPAPTPAPATP